MVIVKHEVDTLTYAMPKIHWKYVSCGCHSTVHLQISALLRYYVHSVSVSPLGKKKAIGILSIKFIILATLLTVLFGYACPLLSNIHRPTHTFLNAKVFHWKLPPFVCSPYTVLHRLERKRVELIFFN